MGLFDNNVSTLGSTALSAGLGFLGNLGGSVAGGLFSANQAKKNRAFQERMYNKQVEDNIKFWNMQNEYNLPSAQLERLKDENGNYLFNPQLVFGAGGNMENVASGAPESATAPHGAQGNVSSFHTPIEMANLALLNAQVKNINADTEQKKSQTAETDFDVMFKRLNADLEREIKFGTLDQLNAVVRDYNNQIWNRNELTNNQVLSMIQDREYQVKRFHMDKEYQGNMIAQGWENLSIGRLNADASLRQAAAAMIQARNAAAIGSAQIALFAQEYALNSKLNPIKLDTANFEKLAKEAGWKTEQARTFERVFKNKMLEQFGTENMSPTYTGLAGFSSQLKLGLSNILDPRWWLSPLGTYHKK